MWANEASSTLTDESLIAWVRTVLPLADEARDQVTVKISPLSGAGGLSAQMLKITVDCLSGPSRLEQPLSYVLKMNHAGGLDSSQQLGNAREAHFYQDFSKALLEAHVQSPVVHYAEGNMEDGSYRLLMDDLSTSAVQSGYFFGPGSPLNWGKDLSSILTAVNPPVSYREVALDTFVQMARMHRKFWRDESLITKYDWLRGRGYFLDLDQERWQGEQDRARTAWAACKAKIDDGTTGIKWNAHLVACVDASINKSNWNDFLTDRKTTPWTLVHGDMHPANVLWQNGSQSGPPGTSIFVDWAMVGLGSGPQDMAQYIISHTAPNDRRLIEKELLVAYHRELTSNEEGNAVAIELHDELKQYSFDDCWAAYVRGGAQRWVWLFCVLTTLCPDFVNQYFHDQLAAFLEDHNVTPETIGMPL